MVKRENGHPEEQYILIIMYTFKGQDNDRLRELCSENYYEVVILPHNLTSKFQPLDISVNKAAKAFIQNMYNEWLSNEVATQLNRGVDPTEVKIQNGQISSHYMHLGLLIFMSTCKKKQG